MSSPKKTSESYLVKKLYEGSSWAFDQLFNLHYNAVYQQAFKILDDYEMAGDVAQEVFIKLWMQRERIAGLKMETLKPYLLVSARNLSIDESKGQKRRQEHHIAYAYENIPVEQPVIAIEKNELSQQVQQALAYIKSPRRRQVVEEIYLKEENRRHVMVKMNISYNTIKEQLQQAIKILRGIKASLQDYR